MSDSENKLAGKIALVTGGAQGIGLAIAARLQGAGAVVCILDCDCSAGMASAESLTAANPAFPVQFLPTDLENVDEIRAVAHAIQTRYGRLDILVNNAGVEIDQPFVEMSVERWDRTIAVNLRAPFLLAQVLLPLFPAGGGSVINVSSIHSTHAFSNSTAYACAKAGMLALTRNLALELAPRHIRVNAICPGYIDTRLWEEYLRQSPDPEGLAEQTAALHPTGRRGVPDDVAKAALFFATEDSSFVTGTQLVVDGGLTIRAHP